MSAIRVASKNMCSVRHRPMPSAPNFTACSRVVRGVGVGADAQLASRVRPAHQGGEVAGNGSVNGRDRLGVHLAGGAVDGSSSRPRGRRRPPMVTVLASSSTRDARRSRRRSRCPCRGQQQPRGRSCRRGRSGCPAACAMPSMSSGEVSRRTRTTFSPVLAAAVASSAVKYTMPQAAPGRGGQTHGDRLRLLQRDGVKLRVQQGVELLGLHLAGWPRRW